jgi:lactoylglutathione lyase
MSKEDALRDVESQANEGGHVASGHCGVSELRLVVIAEDYEAALHFYRDVLGLREQESYTANGGHVAILQAGRATLEINDPLYAQYIDEVEVGRRAAGHMRVAFEVAAVRASTDDLVQAGAQLVAPPTVTPWETLNSRLEGPAGLQLTLFGPVEAG